MKALKTPEQGKMISESVIKGEDVMQDNQEKKVILRDKLIL